jgi:uncharacterized membrane protein
MAFYIGLLFITFLIMLISRLVGISRFHHFWDAARFSAAIMFVQIGMMHLTSPEKLVYMIENFMPYSTELVILSGITEILFGLALLWPRTRVIAAWLLILQLLAMFPANIYVAAAELPPPGDLPASPWYSWSRLLFQPVYIWWIWKSSIQNETRAKFATFGVMNRFFK